MSYRVVGKPWDYAGSVDVRDCKTSLECMQKAGLDFEVAKTELYAKIPLNVIDIDSSLDKANYHKKHDSEAHIHGKNLFTACPNSYCTYRKDHDYPLGFVKQKYTIVQNREAFKFFDDAVGENKAKWETAGWFGNGERIFVSAKLPDTTLVKGDPVDNYLLFTNSHDGSGGVKILFTPIRVICQNTLTAAIRNATNYVSYRHTQSVHSNIEEAYKVLGISKKMQEYTSDIYNLLASIKMTDEDVMKYICEFNMTKEEADKLLGHGNTYKQLVYRNGDAFRNSEISTKKLNVMHEMYDYYHSGAGQDKIAGTAWGAFNAVTGYYSNVDNSEGRKRMDSLLFGDKARKLAAAIDYEFAV